MTNEKLEDLNALQRTIAALEAAITEIETHDYISIYGWYHSDSASDWILSSDDQGFEGFRDYILDFLRKKLAEAEKKFEEA